MTVKDFVANGKMIHFQLPCIMSRKADEVIEGMAPWFKEVSKERKSAKSIKSRSEYQRGWDSAVCAVSEFVRRMQDYNENLASDILKMATPIE